MLSKDVVQKLLRYSDQVRVVWEIIKEYRNLREQNKTGLIKVSFAFLWYFYLILCYVCVILSYLGFVLGTFALYEPQFRITCLLCKRQRGTSMCKFPAFPHLISPCVL